MSGMCGRTVVEALQRVGIKDLLFFDGCICSGCELQGVHIDVSCHKSGLIAHDRGWRGNVLRVWSRHMDVCGEGEYLKSVAQEVIRQIGTISMSDSWAVRYCDYSMDSKVLCTYCEKEREDVSGYLCAQCAGKEGAFVGGRVKDDYDFKAFEFKVEADVQA